MIAFIILSDFVGLEKTKLYVSSFLLIVLSSLRYYVGVDYQVYAYIYDWLGKGLASFQIEKSPLFAMLMQICIKLNLGYQFVVFVAALIFLLSYQYFIKNIVSKRYWMLSYFLLFSTHLIFFSFNIFRQCMGLGIVLAGFTYWYKHEKKSYLVPLICQIIAFFIHNISIVFAIIYLMNVVFRKGTHRYRYFFLFSYLLSLVFVLINPSTIINNLPPSLLGEYYNYLGTVKLDKNSLAIFKQIIPNFIFLIYFKKIWSIDRSDSPYMKYFENTLFHGFFLFIIVNNIGTGSELIIRISMLFQVFYIVGTIGMLLSISSVNNIRSLIYWGLIIYGFLMVAWVGITNGYGVSNYEVFFDKPLLVQRNFTTY